MKKAYLAYGSNMSTEQMAIRCPRAKVIGTGVLKDWRLMFKGVAPLSYATIEKWEGYQVPFVLWELTRRNEMRLDLYEGYPGHYHKDYIEAEVNGEKYQAMFYAKDASEAVDICDTHYYVVLAEAYEKFGFDMSILKEAWNFAKERNDRIWDLKNKS